MATIYEVLQSTGLPCVFSHFKEPVKPPYLAYIGDGQDTASADDTYYWRENRYQIEYYFTKKSEADEAVIEDKLLANGFYYTKSPDTYIESEGVWVIYYNV